MPKAVMFDCYNTLLRYVSKEDKEGIWEMLRIAISYICGKELEITEKELEDLYQVCCEKVEKKCIKAYGQYAEMDYTEVWYQVLMKLNLSRKMAREKAKDVLILHRIYARKINHLFPNVEKELMELKKQGIKLALLSNAQTCFVRDELPQEIWQLFDAAVVSQEVGIKKPSREVFRMLFAELAVKPKDVVFIGDSASDDMIPSGELGCNCVMIVKDEKKDTGLSHVVPFSPYKKTGYAGFAELILNI